MRRLCPVLAVAALALVAGCVTPSPEERAAACAATDWHRYGVNDGKLGVPVSERAAMFADCASLGHPVAVAAYRAGRADGLRAYCTVESGYEVGRTGRGYENVCPPELAPDFLQGLAEGREDRPDVLLYPGIGIGIGSGGVRTGIGIGIGGWGPRPFARDCHWRDPFPCGRFGRGPFGYPYRW